MKLQVLFVLSVIVLATVSAGEIKTPPAAADVTPQWNCKRVDLINSQAGEAKADATKCEYIEFVRQKMIDGYTTPAYPSCFSQMDTQCTEKVSSFYEKKNIKIFSASLVILCTTGGQWDEFVALLATFQTKFADAFNTDYWNCIKDKADEYVTAQFVPFPSWPAPFLDVMNYVCQGVESGLKNQDRIDFQAFFDDNGSFLKLTALGQPLWSDLNTKLQAATINVELQTCLVAETAYFHNSCIPEVDGAYNVHEQKGDDFDLAHLEIYEDEENKEEIEQLNGGAPFEVEGEYVQFQCWNYYAPKKHYHESQDKVSEDQFDGNRGHPGCPANTIYQPLSMYGPICCPIHPVDEKPRTYNCCQKSNNLPQMTGRGRRMRTMNRNAACYGCTCLEGFEMDVQGDYWGSLDDAGACVAKVYDQEE